VCGWQVKLCDPLLTHGPYLSALEVHDEALYKSTFTLLTLLCLAQLCRVRVRAIRAGVAASVLRSGSTILTTRTSASATNRLEATTVNTVINYALLTSCHLNVISSG